MKVFFKYLLLLIVLSSCFPDNTKLYLPEWVTEDDKDGVFISPYYAINHLSNNIMDSDVDESVIPLVYATLNEVVDSLGRDYYKFFKIDENSKIEFIIETNNLYNDCYIEVKKSSKSICIQKKGNSFFYTKRKYKVSDFKLSGFISACDSEGGSHLHYIILKHKNDIVIIEAYSLIQ